MIFKRLIKSIKDLQFKMQMNASKAVLKESESLLAYPVLVHMEFNPDWYYKRFQQGISVKDSVIKRADIIAHSLMRKKKKKHSDETHERYYRIIDFIEEQREINQAIELGNKLADEYESKQQNT